jgi:hypothetical protein
MSRKTQIRFGGLVTALLVSLVFASGAQAHPDGSMGGAISSTPQFSNDRASDMRLSGGWLVHQALESPAYTGAVAPDRVDRLGGAALPIRAGVVVPPDRGDKLGTLAGARPTVTTLVAPSSSSFSWSDALIGAAAALGIVLLAGIGVLMTRRHGGVAQPS